MNTQRRFLNFLCIVLQSRSAPSQGPCCRMEDDGRERGGEEEREREGEMNRYATSLQSEVDDVVEHGVRGSVFERGQIDR